MSTEKVSAPQENTGLTEPKNEKDTKESPNKDDKFEEVKEKLTNYIFSFLLIVTLIGSFRMYNIIEEFRMPLIEANPNYNFPTYSELLKVLFWVPIVAIIRVTLSYLIKPLCYKILAEKYKNPSDEENYEMGKIYLVKLNSNIIKFSYFTFISIFGYCILRNLDYFPTSLGGSGYISKMWEVGYPNAYLHAKPDYFDFYYLLELTFCLTDLLWIVFIDERQTDFLMMILHHFCTISLISFSFVSNYSNIGCIVLLLHSSADVWVYVARVSVLVDMKKILVILAGVILLFGFMYTRLFVLMQVLVSIYTGVTWKWEAVTTFLFTFLCFLYVMHINWVYLIIRKFATLLLKGKKEDTAKIIKCAKNK